MSAVRPRAVMTAPAATANAAPGRARGSPGVVTVSQASICWAPSMNASSPPAPPPGVIGRHGTPSTVTSTAAVSDSAGSRPAPYEGSATSTCGVGRTGSIG